MRYGQKRSDLDFCLAREADQKAQDYETWATECLAKGWTEKAVALQQVARVYHNTARQSEAEAQELKMIGE